MPVGVILLFGASVLVFFGLAHRILDHLKLSDLGAVLFLVAMIAGSFINIPILRGRIFFSLNVGGGILPIALGLYILIKAGSTMEWARALAGTVVTGGIIWGITHLVSFEPGHTFLDPMLIFGIVAGVVGYLAGRSRRGSFVAATWGLLLTDLGNLGYLLATGQSGRVVVGGAGVFDTIVLAGFLAVIISELIGESRERIAGGPKTGPDRPEGLHDPDLEMSWEKDRGDASVEFAQDFAAASPESKEELWGVLMEGTDVYGPELSGKDTQKEELGFPSQLGEREIVQELYGDDDEDNDEEFQDDPNEDENGEEADEELDGACEDNEEDLLGAILDVTTEQSEEIYPSSRRFIPLGGGVELSFEEENEDEA